MNRKWTKRLLNVLIIAVLLAAAVYFYPSKRFDKNAMAGIPDYSNIDQTSMLEADDISTKLEPSYTRYFEQLQKEGKSDTEGVDIRIPSSQNSGVSPAGTREADSLGGQSGKVVVLEAEDSWIEFSIDIPRDGFYQIGMSYYPIEGRRSALLRNVQIDGKFPFFQAKRMVFQRMWKEAGPTWTDNQGNEYNPDNIEVPGWQYKDFRDADAKVSEPFRFYLSQGVHTVRINNLREAGAIGELSVHSPVTPPSYEQVRQQYDQQGYHATTGQFIKVQAEQAVLKSDPTLRRIENREPLTEPYNSNGIVLNAFGDRAWKTGGQWAEWEFDVPQSGLYEIGGRFGSWWLNGVPVERIVTIDDKLPFKEMNSQKFPYKEKWQVGSLSDKTGKPFLFYLEKGKRRIRMEVQIGSLGSVFDKVQDVSHKMSLLSREIILYTGTNPDPNLDWELDKKVTNLVPRLRLMAREIDTAMNEMIDLGVSETSSSISQLGMTRDQLLHMADNPDTIPSRLDAMTETQSSLGSWINSQSEQSLDLDWLAVKSPDVQWPSSEAGFLKKTWHTIHDFALSFRHDYSGIGNIYDGDKTLDVWVARGRDWAMIIKQLADNDFTPKTGIKVNVNVIPVGAMNLLMLAETSGKAPDVALGVDGQVPIDFAIRNAVVNLNELPDYKEVAGRFRPGALIPYRFNGGDYALPENQNFNMLFYRKDILQQLGITKVPETWEEVMDIIPTLQKHGMDFYYPHADAISEFAPFLFQNGGDFYKDNGKTSDLDSPEALQAFKMWTGLFTNYKISKQANFYNRFRSGEMPIGVADYSTYLMLSTAAPELTGWWGMSPMPGIKQPDGKINRSTGGMSQTGMIFKSSDKQQQSWDFLKWWTSADIQEQFGTELESILGVEARWNTANVEAINRLPWPSEDLAAILEQWNWFREREVVLGGYYTNRYVDNIWNQIVLSGQNRREAVEDGVKEINRELRKKREEFGLDQ
ncbi:extracellular solute-binding protein [Cohnella pontilimi]|uniref:Extracellular solute-binding protein n=1 Tax=Cohnella pontilimi TaxID=2564100 RepID=A0A4U0FBS4_9BACL|nr:extracellular solute-binding protein [Cohnella pontilimi]TJY42170.1 extracellular solute-binding protein [Cohnella pontilimi]